MTKGSLGTQIDPASKLRHTGGPNGCSSLSYLRRRTLLTTCKRHALGTCTLQKLPPLRTCKTKTASALVPRHSVGVTRQVLVEEFQNRDSTHRSGRSAGLSEELWGGVAGAAADVVSDANYTAGLRSIGG